MSMWAETIDDVTMLSADEELLIAPVNEDYFTGENEISKDTIEVNRNDENSVMLKEYRSSLAVFIYCLTHVSLTFVL